MYTNANTAIPGVHCSGTHLLRESVYGFPTLPGRVLGVRNATMKRVVVGFALPECLFVCVHVCTCVFTYLA